MEEILGLLMIIALLMIPVLFGRWLLGTSHIIKELKEQNKVLNNMVENLKEDNKVKNKMLNSILEELKEQKHTK